MGNTTGESERTALGVLLVLNSGTERSELLIGYEPLSDKRDEACARVVYDIFEDLGIDNVQQKIGCITDAGQGIISKIARVKRSLVGLGEYISLIWAICGSHTFMRSLDCVIDLAEKYFGMDKSESEILNKFLIYASNGLSAKESKSLKLTRKDPRSLSEYFHELCLKGDDKVKFYKYSHDTKGMKTDEIEQRAAKSALKYPALYVSFCF